jgi:hypothetical protein
MAGYGLTRFSADQEMAKKIDHLSRKTRRRQAHPY